MTDKTDSNFHDEIMEETLAELMAGTFAKMSVDLPPDASDEQAAEVFDKSFSSVLDEIKAKAFADILKSIVGDALGDSAESGVIQWNKKWSNYFVAFTVQEGDTIPQGVIEAAFDANFVGHTNDQYIHDGRTYTAIVTEPNLSESVQVLQRVAAAEGRDIPEHLKQYLPKDSD